MAPFYYWLAGFVALGVGCLFAQQDSWRAQCRRIMLLYVSAFVFWALVFSAGVQGRLSHASVAMDADRAEIMLRLGMAYSVLEQHWRTGGSLTRRSQADSQASQMKRFHEEAKTILETCLNESPESTLLKAKLAILLFDGDDPKWTKQATQLVRELSERKVPKDHELGAALVKIYGDKPVPPDQESSLNKQLEASFHPGWYRDAATLRLYLRTGDKAQYNALHDGLEQKAAGMMLNIIYIVVVGLMAILIGLVVIVVQFFIWPGREAAARNDNYWREAQPWNLRTVYVVFISWLASEIALGSLMQQLLKSSGFAGSGPLATAIGAAGSYLTANAPGIFYIYWFACRPAQQDLLNYIRLKFHSGRLGPFKLVFSGLATWCAAVPIVCIGCLLGSKLLGSQGSSNPIITLVLEAARSSNGAAIVLFYMTLAVFAPLCEEALFRGFLYSNLRRRFGMGVSLLVSASLFAAAHLDPGAVVPLLCLGLVFGYVFERTKSLVPSMIAHGLWNSGSFTMMLLLFGS